MEIKSLRIKNYKFIKDLEIRQMENACILIGRNSVGKSAVLDAVMAACGQLPLVDRNFASDGSNVEIKMLLSVSDEDLRIFHRRGIVNRYKNYDLFYRDFCEKFPSYKDGAIEFTFVANRDGRIRYSDGVTKDNPNIPLILPKIYYIDHRRNIGEIERDILHTGIREETTDLLKENKCMFDESRDCNACFQCIGKIAGKRADELTVFETEKLLEYKMLHMDSDDFMERLNSCFTKNTGLKGTLVNHINVNLDNLMDVNIVSYRDDSDDFEPTENMSDGMKSIYILSLLEAYMQESEKLPCILMFEDPELFLHPQLQKTAGEILYRLSEKNQVIFCTHSPLMIFNFTKKQIKQVVLDSNGLPRVLEDNDIGRILDDLGYSANDFMNVSFVFIVEGKQDKSRLPMLLDRYYSEVYDSDGELMRIAIISTNSCTNIKTYANLKYINKLYLKDQFLMIRDGDGKDAEELKRSLCRYYDERGKEDAGGLPRVREENVLILRYYSFENYFFNPKIMAAIGVVGSEDDFYRIFYAKYKEYLYKIRSFVNLREKTGIEINSPEDIKNNLDTILIYARGHNLFDIFYGRYKGEKETEILKKYIDLSTRDDFKDILDAIDKFVYFDSRKK
ncbi:MAG: ATP-binding protein [Lachnospiraceae bacterium]|nr:ATP-binding protein [Lachnospiraceae bacterium]